ncbi:MAG: hypothetical protein ACXW18_09945 [Pyrinomonadaceae bacterium]
MLRSALLIFCVLCAAILIGCSKTETSNTNTTTENSNKTGATTSTPATTTASTGDKVGIPECDDFIAKYEACVSGKVPEMARGPFQISLKTWRAEWKKLADNPQTRGTLAAGCKQAAEQANASMKAYGCTF